MKAIRDILVNNDLKVRKYQTVGNSTFIDTDDNRYVIRKKGNNQGVLEYLNSRNLSVFPDIIDSNNDYIMYNYIDDNNIPEEQKMNDLIGFISYLHSKTSFYKSIDEAEYKRLYEDLSNNILYLKDYYNDIIALIDSKVYPSPPEYWLQRNISLLFSCLNYCEENIKAWYEKVKNFKKMRVSLIHNDLRLDHFLESNRNYLVSWDKAKFDIPIFDIYKLYNKYGNKFDFDELLSIYKAKFKLSDDELGLFYLLINMPTKIEFKGNNYNMCIVIKNELARLNQAVSLTKATIKS